MTWGTQPIMQHDGTIDSVLASAYPTIYATNTHGDIIRHQAGSAPFTKNLFVGNGTKPTRLAYANSSLFAISNGAVDNFQILRLVAGNNWASFAVPDGGTPRILGGGPFLYMIYPGAVMRSAGQPHSWTPITPPAASGNLPGNASGFACDRSTIYAILPDATVSMYTGIGTSWTKIRAQETSQILAGGEALYAIDNPSGNIFKFNGTPESWTKIGSPGKMFAVGDSGELYGLVPDGSKVVQWNGQPESWSVVGPTAAGKIFAGGAVLCATSPDNNALWCFQPTADTLVLNVAV